MNWQPFRASRKSPSAPPSPAPATPDTHPEIAGYRIGEPMGVGPLGTVYQARHVETGIPVVFRGFSRPADADPAQWGRAKEQFRDLLASHQRVDDHPNIQKVLAFGEEDGLFWIAAEYFEGVTLQSILATESGAQPLAWAVAIFAQVAAAVDWARERGLCHTDLTPFNILLVTPEGKNVRGVPAADAVQVKVINFGLAHARSKYGSPYAAPEQMDGYDGDRKSDVYGVGALLYAVLTGRPLFEGATPDEIAQKVRTAAPAPPLALPPTVRTILAAMLDKNADRRPASVGQAINDLRRGMLTAPSSPVAAPLAAPGTGETDGGRFSRLELDASPMQPPSGGVATVTAAAGAGATAHTYSEGQIGIQDFRLSGQDVVEVRQRLAKARRDAEDVAKEKRQRWATVARFGTVTAVLALLMWHASTIPDGYRHAVVVGQTGKAFVRRDGKNVPLRVGDRFPLNGKDAAGNALITTDSDARVMLDIAGTRLHLREGSALAVRQADYRGGPIRRFDLRRGSVVARVVPRPRNGAVFEIASAGIRAVAKGTLYGVARVEQRRGKAPQVLVATQEGSVRVVCGADRKQADAGEQVWTVTGKNTLPDSTPLEKTAEEFLAKSQQAIASVRDRPSFLALLARYEESLILPLVEGITTLFRLPTYLSDRQAQVQAVGAMQGLCLLMQTSESISGSGGPPASVDLQTLAELGMKAKDSQRILKQFRNGRLVSYRPLPDDGYEFLAHANDSGQTLVRGRNGVASLVGNDDTDFAEDADGGGAKP